MLRQVPQPPFIAGPLGFIISTQPQKSYIMKNLLTKASLLPIILAILSYGCSNERLQEPSLSQDFSQKVQKHIIELTKNGSRYLETTSLKAAEEYISMQFEQIGLKTSIENFDYESFEINNSQLLVGDLILTPSRICFNPYKDSLNISGNFALIEELPSNDIANSYVITTSKLNYFQMVINNPKMIIYVDSLDFVRLSEQKINTFKLRIEGVMKQYQSANIVADLKPNADNLPTIIVCAHYDSFLGSSGAGDNASGTAAMIELSRVFKNYKKSIDGYNIRFIAFTGEEKGLLGSRHYLDFHKSELKNTELVINMDQIGGLEPFFITVLDSIRGIPAIKGETQFPIYLKDRVFDGINSDWTIIAPEIFKLMTVSNTPNWLVDAIKKSSEGINVSFTSSSGSDELTFIQAGVVATCIFTQGNQTHNNKDLPDQINSNTIENICTLIIRLIINTMNHNKT